MIAFSENSLYYGTSCSSCESGTYVITINGEFVGTGYVVFDEDLELLERFTVSADDLEAKLEEYVQEPQVFDRVTSVVVAVVRHGLDRPPPQRLARPPPVNETAPSPMRATRGGIFSTELKSMLKQSSLVVHCKREAFDVYIGRPTDLGNPYEIGKHGTRDEVIEKYEVWLRKKLRNKTFRAEFLKLKGKRLGCWCRPLACHGDVIVKLLNELSSE